jgi:hypothetical protein
MIDRIEQLFGLFLFLLVLADVFVAVLYARANTGVLWYRVAWLTWKLFFFGSKLFPKRRASIMSFCGPAILVIVIIVWATLLTLSAALIIHPELGSAVRAASGDTVSDFATALYAGGSSIAIVGAGDFTPHTNLFRLFYLVASLVGISFVSLTLTYIMQVYSALHRRNTLGLMLHLASGETGDAAEIIAGLGPEEQFPSGYTNLSTWAVEMATAKELHHFYPVLFYFRFVPPYYAISRFALLSLDAVTLIKSALDHQRYAWLKESSAVTQLWRASMLLLKTASQTYTSRAPKPAQQLPDAQTLESWRQHYRAAVKRLQHAGIVTTADEHRGAEVYTSLRSHWHAQIMALAPVLAYSIDDIDPAMKSVSAGERQQEVYSRLRALR